MFFPEIFAWLVQSGWFMFLHLSARSSFPKPLDRETERRLLDRLFSGDGEAANVLIEHNLRLVAHIAKKYQQEGVEQDDLISVGSLGLIKAVQTFRPEAGRLTAYASRCIENEILMYFRANRRHRAVVLMGDSLGTDRDGNEVELSELLGTDTDAVPEAAELAIESRRALRLIRSALDPRERHVIVERYGLSDGEPKPQHIVAKQLGISRSYVSRIEKKALEKLRRALGG